MKATCSIDNCDNRHLAKGLCQTHYMRVRRTGTAHQRTSEEVFWSRIEKVPGGCWLWTGPVATNGYGRASIDGKNIAAHRYSYERLVGPISDGLELDHVKTRGCTSRACVNPTHLEPVTHRENTLRGDTITADAARRTHCPRGHALVPGNLVPSSLKRGRRGCLTCSREKAAERRRRAA